MAAYVIVQMDVIDQDGIQEYRKRSGPSVTQYGGRFIVRGGKVERIEGDWNPPRLVIIEFPSMEQAHAWHASKEYGEAKAFREKAARNVRTLILEGV